MIQKVNSVMIKLIQSFITRLFTLYFILNIGRIFDMNN